MAFLTFKKYANRVYKVLQPHGVLVDSLHLFQLVLELCRSEQTAKLQTIQPHLDRIRAAAPQPGGTDVSVSFDAECQSSIHKSRDRPENHQSYVCMISSNCILFSR